MKIRHWSNQTKKSGKKHRRPSHSNKSSPSHSTIELSASAKKRKSAPSTSSTSSCASIHSASSLEFSSDSETSTGPEQPLYTLRPSAPSQAFQKSTLPLLSLPKVPQRTINKENKEKIDDKKWLQDSVTAISPTIKNKKVDPFSEYSKDMESSFEQNKNMQHKSVSDTLQEELMDTSRLNQVLLKENYNDDNFPMILLPPSQARRAKFPIGSVAIINHPDRGPIQGTIESVYVDKSTFTPRYYVTEERNGNFHRHKNIREESLQKTSTITPTFTSATPYPFENSHPLHNQENGTNLTSLQQRENTPTIPPSAKRRQVQGYELHQHESRHRGSLQNLVAKINPETQNPPSNVRHSHFQQKSSYYDEVSRSSSQQGIHFNNAVHPPAYQKSSVFKAKHQRVILMKTGLQLKAVACKYKNFHHH